MRKKLGVIGGMGPLATALFMELVIEMTDARQDKEHICMDIVNAPAIPDRTDYILGKSTDCPVEGILSVKKELESRGADVLAMPCNTAFYARNEEAALFFRDKEKRAAPASFGSVYRNKLDIPF